MASPTALPKSPGITRRQEVSPGGTDSLFTAHIPPSPDSRTATETDRSSNRDGGVGSGFRRSSGHRVATRVSSPVSRRPLIPRRMDRITHTTASADPAYTTHATPHAERTAHDVTTNGRENGVAGRERSGRGNHHLGARPACRIWRLSALFSPEGVDTITSSSLGTQMLE